MNRKQRVKMIVRVLLFPFTRDPFPDQDLLLKHTQAYQRLRDHQGLYRDLAYRCDQARKAVVYSLADEIKPDRLSELGELLEMFYPVCGLAEHLDKTGGRRTGGILFKNPAPAVH